MSFLVLKAEYLKERAMHIDSIVFAANSHEYNFLALDERYNDWISYHGAQGFGGRAKNFQIVEINAFELMLSFDLEYDETIFNSNANGHVMPVGLNRRSDRLYTTQAIEILENVALPRGFGAWLEGRKIAAAMADAPAQGSSKGRL